MFITFVINNTSNVVYSLFFFKIIQIIQIMIHNVEKGASIIPLKLVGHNDDSKAYLLLIKQFESIDSP